MLTTALCGLLLAAGAIAAPSVDIETRNAAVNETGNSALGSDVSTGFPVPVGPPSRVGFESTTRNWAGLQQTKPPKGTHFSAIKGTFKMPKPINPQGSKGEHTATAWVGLDGEIPTREIVQAGCVASSTKPMYCWWDWFANTGLTVMENFSPEYNDHIEVTITAPTKSKAIVAMHNVNSGQHATTTIHPPNPTATLVGLSAEWIVEDLGIGGGKYAPFADFKTVEFTNCHAQAGEHNIGLKGANPVKLEIGGKIHTKNDVKSDHGFNIIYLK